MGTDIHGYVEVNADTTEYGPSWEAIISAGSFLDRNYNLFGVLAGVRDYRTGKHLSKPLGTLGMPEAPGYNVRSDNEYYSDSERKFKRNPDLHSHRYMKLSEIMEYDWQQTIYVNEPNPDYSDEDMEAYMVTLKEWRESDRTAIRPQHPAWLSVPKTLEEYHEKFFVIVRLMEVLVEKYGDENVRLVIWFDN